MRILVVTRESWSNNSTGNTMTSFFKDFSENVEIHNLYFRESAPNNSIAKSTFRISERQIINRILKKKECGEYVYAQDEGKNFRDEAKMYQTAKKSFSYIPYFLREMLWATNVWQNDSFHKYLVDLKPDVVFSSVFPCWYTQKVLLYIKKVLPKTKIVLFHADDTYTLKQFSFVPSFWLFRFNQRKWIKRIVNHSSINYVISKVQKEEYDKLLGIETKILTKFDVFNGFVPPKLPNDTVHITYTGNLSLNRWKVVALLSKTIMRFNKNSNVKFYLDIYSATLLTKKQIKLIANKYCTFHGKVSGDRIPLIQSDADLLLHVESFDLKNRLAVRQSFSTKIVDYLHSARAVLAIGPKSVASIQYFRDNGIGFVCTDKKELLSCLCQISQNLNAIVEKAKSSYEVGMQKHSKDKILHMLECDLYDIVQYGG